MPAWPQGCVSDEALGLEVEARLDPIDHRLGGLDFGGAVCRCGLDVDDHTVLGVDEVVRRVRIDSCPLWSSSNPSARFREC